MQVETVNDSVSRGFSSSDQNESSSSSSSSSGWTEDNVEGSSFSLNQVNDEDEVLITDDMIKEEERLQKEKEAAEKKMLEENRSKFDIEVEKNKFQRLQFLLERSSLYSNFLIERMKAQRAEPEKKAKAKPKGKTKSNSQDGNTAVRRSGRNGGSSTSSQQSPKRTQRPANEDNTDEGLEKKKTKKRKKENELVVREDNSYVKSADDDEEEEQEISSRQPKLVTGGVLREYQLQGVEWMISLFENGLNGILADEMGLGKTLQSISLLAHLRAHRVWGPFLVVAPLSTINNWSSEFHRFTPSIPTIVYHGSKEEREEMRRERMRVLDSSFPVVITSYNIFMNDRKALQKYNWKFLIVDEGQRIKNLNCRLIQELKAIPSANRLLLTGTPLQNSLSELWSLLNFIMPDIFSDLNSFESFFDVISAEDQDDERDERVIKQEQENQIVSKLHAILKPFLLRRLKVDVETQMPGKKEVIVYTPLTELQHEYYEATLDRTLRAVLQRKSGSSLNNLKDPMSGESIRLMNVLMQLRKVCNHPYLFHWPQCEDDDQHLRVDEELIQSAGKLQLLDRMLPILKEKGHKVLIFSQFVRMLDILEDFLMLREYNVCRLDGSTSHEDRTSQMHSFNNEEDQFVFLLSTRAGGLGINLVSADTVIFYDSDWNPQADIQAQDRCHRIGQTRPVMIYRLVTGNSVEERILERARKKRTLEKLVTSGNFKGLLSGTNRQEKIQVEELVDILTNDEITRAGNLDEEEKEKQQQEQKRTNKEVARAKRGGKQLSDEELDALLDREAMFKEEEEYGSVEEGEGSSGDQSSPKKNKLAFKVVEGASAMRVG